MTRARRVPAAHERDDAGGVRGRLRGARGQRVEAAPGRELRIADAGAVVVRAGLRLRSGQVRSGRDDVRLRAPVVGGPATREVDDVAGAVCRGVGDSAAVGRTDCADVLRGADGDDVLGGAGRVDRVGARAGVPAGDHFDHPLVPGHAGARIAGEAVELLRRRVVGAAHACAPGVVRDPGAGPVRQALQSRDRGGHVEGSRAVEDLGRADAGERVHAHSVVEPLRVLERRARSRPVAGDERRDPCAMPVAVAVVGVARGRFVHVDEAGRKRSVSGYEEVGMRTRRRREHALVEAGVGHVDEPDRVVQMLRVQEREVAASERRNEGAQRAVHDPRAPLVMHLRLDERLDRDHAAQRRKPVDLARVEADPLVNDACDRDVLGGSVGRRFDLGAGRCAGGSRHRRDDHLRRAGQVESRKLLVGRRVRGERANERSAARQVGERAECVVVTAHELPVLGHVADDRDAGRLDGGDPRVLERAHVLDDREAARAFARACERAARLAEERRAPRRIGGLRPDPDHAHVVAKLSSGGEERSHVRPGGLDQRERVVRGDGGRARSLRARRVPPRRRARRRDVRPPAGQMLLTKLLLRLRGRVRRRQRGALRLGSRNASCRLKVLRRVQRFKERGRSNATAAP